MTRERDAGAATVLVLALSAVVMLAGTVAAALGGVAVAGHRAASVADAAALAAAARVAEGPVRACAAASRVARAAGGELASCRIEGRDAVTRVTVRPPGALGALGVATGSARAGPAEPRGWAAARSVAGSRRVLAPDRPGTRTATAASGRVSG